VIDRESKQASKAEGREEKIPHRSTWFGELSGVTFVGRKDIKFERV
jgi:hypothetical protein